MALLQKLTSSKSEIVVPSQPCQAPFAEHSLVPASTQNYQNIQPQAARTIDSPWPRRCSQSTRFPSSQAIVVASSCHPQKTLRVPTTQINRPAPFDARRATMPFFNPLSTQAMHRLAHITELTSSTSAACSERTWGSLGGAINALSIASF